MDTTKTVLTLALVLLATCEFNSTKNFVVPLDLVDVEYSKDQSIFVLASPTAFKVYNGVTMKLIQTTQVSPFTITSLAISPDSSSIGVGGSDGNIHTWSLRPGAVEFKQEDDEVWNELDEDALGLPLKSICYSADSKLVVAFSDQLIVVADREDRDFTILLMPSQARSVACHPMKVDSFAISAVSEQGPILNQFMYNKTEGQNGTIIPQDEYVTTKEYLSIIFSDDGNSLFAVGEEPNSIYHYSTIDSAEDPVLIPFVTTLPTGTLSKIRVNKHATLFAAAGANTAYAILDMNNMSDYTVQQFPSTKPVVALTSAGGNLFSVNGLVGSYRSQCDSNAYYNAETEICEACSGSCSSCANSQDDCFSCNPKYYLNGRVCSQCVSPCLECTSSTVCTSCMKPFEFKNKECVCGAGEYINGEKCSSCIIHCASCNNGKTCLVCKSHYSIKNGLCVYDGTPTWLIILLAATAILVVAVIGVFVVKKVKARKDTPLLEDNDA